MPYTIVSDVCEGVADCTVVCPSECIHWANDEINAKGTRYVFIDDSLCVDCGACMSVCPIEGAILDEWQPELQNIDFAGYGPDELAFEARIGDWKWFMRWGNKRLFYGLSGSEGEDIKDVLPPSYEWRDFWSVISEIQVGTWKGDYAVDENAPTIDLGNLRWQLKIGKGSSVINCAGGHLPTMYPPGFPKLVQAFIWLFENAFGYHRGEGRQALERIKSSLK